MVNYTQNHRDSLCTYLQDGRCELFNNTVEWMAKSYAIGMKAFLFHALVAGANASAVIYSLVKTAKAEIRMRFNISIHCYCTCQATKKGLMVLSSYCHGVIYKEHYSGLIDVETIISETHPPWLFKFFLKMCKRLGKFIRNVMHHLPHL